MPGKLAARPTRDGFGEGLLEAGRKDPRVVALCADLTESTRVLPFKQAFPERFVQVGVSEQAMASVAAGMALAGKVPVIASYAMFSPGRNWEQIRTTICLNEAPVVIAGAHAGVSVGPDGATHQAVEDIAILRAIPNMTILVPCDAEETRKATLAACALGTPAYVRFGREASPVLTTPRSPFTVGKAEVLAEGNDVALIACGQMVAAALEARRILLKKKIKARVINCHTIKPLDEATLDAAAQECGAIVTAEEHSVVGGLGGAVAECLARYKPVPMEFVGVQNRFGQSGSPQELMKEYGLTAEDLVMATLRVLLRK